MCFLYVGYYFHLVSLQIGSSYYLFTKLDCLWVLGAVGPEVLCDNVRPQWVYVVLEYLQTEDISRMDWPPYSPDLNPIEHVWIALEHQILARQIPPRLSRSWKVHF